MLLAVVATSGPAAPAASPQVAAPRTAPDVVAVDFRALTATGAPVTDLTAADVSIRTDGRQRVVRTLTYVAIADPAGVGTASAGLAPPFAETPRPDAGRDIFFVIDNDSFRPGREIALRHAVESLIGQLGSVDRLGVAVVPYGRVEADLTTDRSRVLQAMSRITGQAGATLAAQEDACRTRLTLQAIAGLLETFAGRDRPLTMITVTSGLMGPRRDAEITRAPGRCELELREYQLVGAAAARARAQVYLVPPENVLDQRAVRGAEGIAGRGFSGSDNPIEGLEHFVSVTGGRFLNLENPDDDALTRIARETAGYYLAGLDPLSSDRNGQLHRLDVRVSRPDVVVRARPETSFPRSRIAKPPPKAPQEMLRESTPWLDVPMRLGAFVSRQNAAGGLSAVAVAEPSVAGTRLTAAAIGVYDSRGGLAGQWTATADELGKPSLMAAFALPRGIYRVRVAAIDGAGRAGTADYDLEAELVPAGIVRLSSLVLGVSRPTGFEPRLVFSTEAAAIGYLEIYNGQAGMALSVTIELATTLNGPALATLPAVLSATNEPDRFIARATIPIGALAPGDYAVRATVRTPDQPEGRVTRTIRKERKPGQERRPG